MELLVDQRQQLPYQTIQPAQPKAIQATSKGPPMPIPAHHCLWQVTIRFRALDPSDVTDARAGQERLSEQLECIGIETPSSESFASPFFFSCLKICSATFSFPMNPRREF